MRTRVARRPADEAEAVVRERLRSILAASAARTGWVPERVGESPDRLTEEPERSEILAPIAPPRRQHDGLDGPALRWDPGRPGALAMCVVAVVAALLAAGITWWSRPSASTVDAVGSPPVAAAAPASAAAGADPEGRAGSAPEGAANPSSSAELVVSVIGQVHQPGLVTVVPGARVADAIAAAGGALPEADLSTVNLARLVVDGEQIGVGVPGSALPGAGEPSASAGLVNLNSAAQSDLEDLPGIGPVLAGRIIEYREDNGGFDAVEQLREVDGIGPALYEDIADLVTV